jgi:hypothetical protein
MNHRLGFTGRLAGASARHPWRVVGLWVAIIAVAFFRRRHDEPDPEPRNKGHRSY